MSDTDNSKSEGPEEQYQTPPHRLRARRNRELTQHRLRHRGRLPRLNNTDKEISSYYQDLNPYTIAHSTKELGDFFEKAGVKLSESEKREALETKQEDITSPDFPYFMFSIALAKDIIDAIATVTIIGIVVSVTLSFLCSLVLFIWTMDKLGMSGSKLHKKRTQGILTKYGLSMGIEFIPGINVIPTTSLFVLLAYLKEAKISKLHKLALTKIHRMSSRRT